MERKYPIVIKLGGALITHKDKPLSINFEKLDLVCSALSNSTQPIILVHGGGSFGHYYAEMYHLSSKASKASAIGVTRTKMAMLHLNLQILNLLEKYGMYPYPIQPSNIIDCSMKFRKKIIDLIECGFIPVTYGDVYNKGRYFFVLSGDKLTRIISNITTPKQVIFLLNIDGVFKDLNDPDSLIKDLKLEDLADIKIKSPNKDVTGGMMLKLEEALKIAKSGINVMLINGSLPERIDKAIKGERTIGTFIRGHKIE